MATKKKSTTKYNIEEEIKKLELSLNESIAGYQAEANIDTMIGMIPTINTIKFYRSNEEGNSEDVRNKANIISDVRQGFEAAYIDGNAVALPEYKPHFISNDYKEGKKVFSSIIDELNSLEKGDEYMISVAFIKYAGLLLLSQALKEADERGVKGKIITTNYYFFSEPRALSMLSTLKNAKVKMFDSEKAAEGFHTKGYIFKKGSVYHIIIGSSNITQRALTTNKEWNNKIVSTEDGEVAQNIVREFSQLWESPFSNNYDDIKEKYEKGYRVAEEQKAIAKESNVISLDSYMLKPNSMQSEFIFNLENIMNNGHERALLISATGTGKTFASAFAMRELGFKKVLFVVHRNELAFQTKKSFEKVFAGKVSMGIVGGGIKDYDKDYVFAIINTLSSDETLQHYKKDHFDCIILDEAHHSTAKSYQKIMNYFEPKLWLGMTATPDKRDDQFEGKNVYELYDHQIACEIRLQQAMEDDLLCPFSYFGISDIALIEEKELKKKKLKPKDFNLLTSDERVKHILAQADYYKYSGSRVKGIIFCSRIDESKALSEKFNKLGKRTIALNGDASPSERQNAFERLAIEENDERVKKGEIEPLDYIFSVDILNEGVDIVEVNQVIMLRPTQSPIVFIQQLGRGLRKAKGKDCVVVLDFIGNYNKNFMIPIALSGDRTYNPDNIRKYIISGASTMPGASSISFDSISKEKIFNSIDHIKDMKAVIRTSYASLKDRLGRIPYLDDFYEAGEVDPLLIIEKFDVYDTLQEVMEKDSKCKILEEDEKSILKYLSKVILNGMRPHELEVLSQLIDFSQIDVNDLIKCMQENYKIIITEENVMSIVNTINGNFVRNDEERKEFSCCNLVLYEKGLIKRSKTLSEKMQNSEFLQQIRDIVEVGLKKYGEKYLEKTTDGTPFVLYEKYSRRDVCRLMNNEKDISSTMYGMKRLEDDAFLFVTYHKKTAAIGKPDYDDEFIDNVTFKWDTKLGQGIGSKYLEDVESAKRKHLFVKKSDAERSFYYMGCFDIISEEAAFKDDKNGNPKKIAKVTERLHHPVREDILRYLKSSIS